VFDLKSCYFHVRIHPDHTKFFGVKLLLDNQLVYMVYEYLPFGLSSAVHCITKIWKPLIAFFQQQDVPISVYIDDGLFSAASKIAAYISLIFSFCTDISFQQINNYGTNDEPLFTVF